MRCVMRAVRSNRKFGSGLAAIILSALFQAPPLFSGAGVANADETPGDCTAPAEVTQIAPGAFVRHGAIALPNPANRGGIANIGFIIGDKSVAVIDTGGSFCDGLSLRQAIRARTALPIEYIVNTHVHPDHIFGNAAFAEDGSAILAHHNLPRALAERGQHYLLSYGEQVGPAAMKGAKAVPPTKLVEDSLQIDLGGRKLTLVAHRAAHTDNDLTLFDEASGILWTGDLVFLDHIPVLDGSLKGWLSITSELMKSPVRQIVPGHGPPLAPWPKSGDNQIRYLERLASDLRKAINAGVGIGQAADEAGKSESGKWRLFASFNGRNATTGFAQLEWE